METARLERITQFRRNNLTFEVSDSGPTDGAPVVLLHGFPQRGNAWDGVATRLHEAGMRTFAPDQRGYSPGARPRSRFAYRAKELVDDVAALIDDVGKPVHLAAHDWGAVVGWAAAARYPEKVASLTAVSVGHPRSFFKALVTGDQLRRSYYIVLFQLPFFPERSLSTPKSWGERRLLETGMAEEQLDQFRREIVGDGALRGGLSWYRSLPRLAPKDLGRVSVPSTLVWSDGDVALGRTMAEGTAKYVDAPFEFVELTGSHWLLDERPDDVAEAIVRRVRSVELPA